MKSVSLFLPDNRYAEDRSNLSAKVHEFSQPSLEKFV
jgi:hypothetical protein